MVEHCAATVKVQRSSPMEALPDNTKILLCILEGMWLLAIGPRGPPSLDHINEPSTNQIAPFSSQLEQDTCQSTIGPPNTQSCPFKCPISIQTTDWVYLQPRLQIFSRLSNWSERDIGSIQYQF